MRKSLPLPHRSHWKLHKHQNLLLYILFPAVLQRYPLTAVRFPLFFLSGPSHPDRSPDAGYMFHWSGLQCGFRWVLLLPHNPDVHFLPGLFRGYDPYGFHQSLFFPVLRRIQRLYLRILWQIHPLPAGILLHFPLLCSLRTSVSTEQLHVHFLLLLLHLLFSCFFSFFIFTYWYWLSANYHYNENHIASQ